MELQQAIQEYLDYCKGQKMLDLKTLKAYRIDLYQFTSNIDASDIYTINSDILENYISYLHQTYKPKTVKRKIASIKALFHYLEFRDIITINPFNKIQVKFREPTSLPKTIPLHSIEALLKTVYKEYRSATTTKRKEHALRDIAICELLFGTGMRISELCSLHDKDIDLFDGIILIHGKGSKERRLQIGEKVVLQILEEYRNSYLPHIENNGYFFPGRNNSHISDQSVRRMINKYASLATIDMHITPHMFRHSFASSLLDAGVDIRYIQNMLGHSSITITEIYTHVSTARQKEILISKHPRKDFDI